MKNNNGTLNNLLLPGIWNNYYLPIENNLLTFDLLSINLFKFWQEVMHKIDDKYVILLFRIEEENGKISTLGHLQKVNKSNLNSLLLIFKRILANKSNDYHSKIIKNVIISYKIIPGDKLFINKSRLSSRNKNDSNISYNFYGWNLPKTMDYNNFGNIISKNKNIILIKAFNNEDLFKIFIHNDYNEIHLLNSNNDLIVKFNDYIVDPNNLNTFKRIVTNQTYYFKDGELIVKKLARKTSFLKSIKLDKKINNKFMTMDIKTRTIDNVITPYSLCFYDGIKNISFYLTDYNNNIKEMLNEAIKTIMKSKYNGYKIYVHNLSNFDGMFILKTLASIPNTQLKPIIKDGKIIELKLIFGKYNISFRDSYLMLPTSLRKLAIQFKVDNKGIFPYDFVNNKNIDLNYIGNIPEFKYFSNISIEDYNSYCKSFNNKSWDLKYETVKYCIQDCISLYQIITKFNNLIFEKYDLNIHNFPTLPSLSFGIYRAKYLQSYKIPLITGQIFNDISNSYTGGATDVYKPHGYNLFRYAVNSLYPYILKSMDMPIGDITFFEGDITKIEDKPFGFFECEVETPENLKHPILQCRINTGNGIRTVAPLGKWTGMYFSEEIYNAMKFGYKFNILRGYTFDKANIFSEYIDDLYLIKKSHTKDDPMYLISKLLMNSLYGRFGMNYIFYNHIIIEDNELYDFVDNYSINEVIPLDDNKSLISYLDDNKVNSIILSNDSKANISIGIASAITAGARIHMSQFKNNPDYNLYYSDTDSIDIDRPLPETLVGKELGEMKLEYNFIEATFLAPKVYGGVHLDNDNLKELTKVKGFKNSVNYQSLKSLLTKDKSLILNQSKWYRDIENGNIEIKDQIYRLIPTENKRELIYKDNLLVDTKPFIITK